MVEDKSGFADRFESLIIIILAPLLILIPVGLGIGMVIILTGNHLPQVVNYNAADLIVNSFLSLLLVYLYWSSKRTQQKQREALESQSGNLRDQAKSMADLAEIQSDQSEIMEYQRKMMEQQYKPDLDYESISTDGDRLHINLVNNGAGILTNIRIECGIGSFTSNGYITSVSYPVVDEERPPSILRPDEDHEFSFDTTLRIPQGDGFDEVGFQSGMRTVDHDGMGNRWVRVRLLYEDAGGEKMHLPLVEYPRELAGDLSIDGVLEYSYHGEIPEANRHLGEGPSS